MVKYNVGDKVRIVSEPNWWWNIEGLMNKWCGKVMTIRETNVFDGGYLMVEDATENERSGWVWDEADIVERVSSAKKHVGMPKLTTGMFGVMFDGERFVIVNDHVVYQQSGQVDEVEYITEHPELVKALYDSYCFGMVEDGVADVIWENPNPHSEDEEDAPEAPKDYKEDTSPAILALLEKMFGDAK